MLWDLIFIPAQGRRLRLGAGKVLLLLTRIIAQLSFALVASWLAKVSYAFRDTNNLRRTCFVVTLVLIVLVQDKMVLSVLMV